MTSMRGCSIRRIKRFIVVGLWIGLLAVFAHAAEPVTQPTSAPAGSFHGYAGASDDPRSSGFHKLVYQWTEDGRARQIPFAIFLPEGYGSDGRRWPMLTFLAGLGDRGPDPGVSMGVGVPLEIGRDPELRRWLPMIVLTPQCPNDKVWESPGMPQTVLTLIRAVTQRFAVDRAQLSVTGFSNGGRGCWALAAEAPDLFAVTVPVVSREHDAADTASRLAGKGTTCLVISGLQDPKSEPASSHMVDALRSQNVDVVYAPIPNGQHFIWSAFYREKEFYEFLLQHRRGSPIPASRATGERFAQLFAARKQQTMPEVVFDTMLQRDLDRFEPYWFVDNCSNKGRPGLKANLAGRSSVYVTSPLTAEVPCRLQTTRQLPADKRTQLDLQIGRPADGEWELVIRVNEQEVLRKLINEQTAPSGWTEASVDLKPLAGKEARLQLIQQATTRPVSQAYWAKVKLTETLAK